jgi:hypothetical protein
MVKTLRRGQTVTVQKRDITVGQKQSKCLLTSDFDYLRGIAGFSYKIELVASCLSFPRTLILLESEFYNSRYG